MADTSDLSKLDKRTVERYLRNGTIDERTYEKFLKTLPDTAEKGDVISTQMFDEDEESGDDEGDEGETA